MTEVWWRYLDGDGSVIGSSAAFPDREVAEGWLRDDWEELVEAGVQTVVLVEGDAERYRMSLREDGVL